jgi:hypothetical protein
VAKVNEVNFRYPPDLSKSGLTLTSITYHSSPITHVLSPKSNTLVPFMAKSQGENK